MQHPIRPNRKGPLIVPPQSHPRGPDQTNASASPPAMEPPPPPPPATPAAAVRVLSRTPPQASQNPSSAPSTGPGVVAVGFVGGSGAARLADRILDAHVFSPGGSAGGLAGSVRYHRDGNKRMVFLHLTPMEAGGIGGGGDMPEMLFMFSVSSDFYCAFLLITVHAILLI